MLESSGCLTSCLQEIKVSMEAKIKRLVFMILFVWFRVESYKKENQVLDILKNCIFIHQLIKNDYKNIFITIVTYMEFKLQKR
ncbi:hypothetical protein GCM10010976_17440 [Bizionia arctica]|uniref:Uncharacterized protein n=1 Tax=Bizionia arctica TaxID=1495645 RepID=A0A917LNH6_9FLAO|nr:hypothetical protein GCM10010976_17440 [Bizionia arctica]